MNSKIYKMVSNPHYMHKYKYKFLIVYDWLICERTGYEYNIIYIYRINKDYQIESTEYIKNESNRYFKISLNNYFRKVVYINQFNVTLKPIIENDFTLSIHYLIKYIINKKIISWKIKIR